jgi:hypothetical protein
MWGFVPLTIIEMAAGGVLPTGSPLNGMKRRFPGIIGNYRLGQVLLGQHFKTATAVCLETCPF